MPGLHSCRCVEADCGVRSSIELKLFQFVLGTFNLIATFLLQFVVLARGRFKAPKKYKYLIRSAKVRGRPNRISVKSSEIGGGKSETHAAFMWEIWRYCSTAIIKADPANYSNSERTICTTYLPAHTPVVIRSRCVREVGCPEILRTCQLLLHVHPTQSDTIYRST